MWSLTPYEMSREPQAIPTNETRVIQTQSRILEAELQCPICLDTLRNTRTTKECLHRFCEDCIGTALRNGNKECPKCRKKLISMRALRPDPTFDRIIETIFQNRAETDRRHQELLDKLDKSKSDASASEGRVSVGTTAGTSGTSVVEDVPNVNLVLQPFKRKIRAGGFAEFLEKWIPKKRYIKVKQFAKVEHVCRYIIARFLVERPSSSDVDFDRIDVSKVQIYLRMHKDKPDYQLLPHNLTLAQVYGQYWNIERPLELYFAFSGNIKFRSEQKFFQASSS